MDTFDFDDTDNTEGIDPQEDRSEDDLQRMRERLDEPGNVNIEALEEIIGYYFEREHYAESLPYIDRLLEYLPCSGETWQKKGTALHHLQRYREALAAFDQALLFNPIDSELLLNRGLTLDYLGQYEEALGCFERVLQLDSSDEEGLFGKGIIFEKLERYNESVSVFYHIIENNPAHKEAWYELGYCYDCLNNIQQALVCYEKHRHLIPSITTPGTTGGSC